jgi:hypothetical protein
MAVLASKDEPAYRGETVWDRMHGDILTDERPHGLDQERRDSWPGGVSDSHLDRIISETGLPVDRLATFSILPLAVGQRGRIAGGIVTKSPASCH